MTQLLFTLMLVAICPLMMFFMMRGMHGGHAGPAVGGPVPQVVDGSSTDTRIVELEREVARLRGAQPAGSVIGDERPR